MIMFTVITIIMEEKLEPELRAYWNMSILSLQYKELFKEFLYPHH